MKYFVFLLILIGLVCFIIPKSFAEQPQYGKEVSTYLFDYEKKPADLHCGVCPKPNYVPGQLIPDTLCGPENFDEKMGKFLLEFTNTPTNSKEVNLKIDLLDKQNKTIPHVGFFINVTKQDEVISPIFFHAHSGTLKIALNQSDSASDWSSEGKFEPYAGGLESENDYFVVTTPVLAKGNYHFEVSGFSAYDDKSIFIPKCAPKFDWSLVIDEYGRVEIVIDSKSNHSSTIVYDPPLKQFKAGIPIERIQCKENLFLVIKASNGNPACVNEKSVVSLTVRNWAQIEDFEVTSGFLDHQIENGQVLSMNFTKHDCSPSITIKINAEDDGHLLIHIPRIILDSKDGFYVLVNGKEIDFEEPIGDMTQRILDIPFSNSSKSIDIVKGCLI